MAWSTENRTLTPVPTSATPMLTEAMKTHLREKFFPRFPTKRAVLLPALHMVQHAYNWIPTQAIAELAEFLEISPAEALDTASFYEEYWLKPKGKYLVQVCRSFACEICRSEELTTHLQKKLGIEPGDTTVDEKFTLVELECLGACGNAPVVMVNEVLFEDMTPEKLDQLFAGLPEDPHGFKDAYITWSEDHAPTAGAH